jgi:hypothetical protein
MSHRFLRLFADTALGNSRFDWIDLYGGICKLVEQTEKKLVAVANQPRRENNNLRCSIAMGFQGFNCKIDKRGLS